MKCVICRKGSTSPGATTITLERDCFTMVVKGVPAEVCDNCGEAYVEGVVAADLLDSAERMAEAGALIEVRQYVVTGRETVQSKDKVEA
jgi:YgiT-type zinc finger domain-containing protein